MGKNLNDTKAIASQRLPGPYVQPMSFDARDCSPEYSMSRPGFVRETNAGNEAPAGAKAELNK